MARIGLPEGYRLLLTAPGLRVLVDLREGDRVVARYRGEFDAEQVRRDAEADNQSHRILDQEHDHFTQGVVHAQPY